MKWRLALSLIVLVFIAIVVVTPNLVFNLISLSITAEKGSSDKLDGVIWYGLGLHLSGNEAGSIIEAMASDPPSAVTCSENEKDLLNRFVNLPVTELFADSYRNSSLRARHKLCLGDVTSASQFVENAGGGEAPLQQYYLHAALAHDDELRALTMQYLCPSGAEWCIWCVEQMTSPRPGFVEGNSSNPTDGVGVQVYANEHARRIEADSIQEPIQLMQETSTSIELAGISPLVIAGISSASDEDNFIEYESVPVDGSALRYRVTGALLNGNEAQQSCVSQRLILWDKHGSSLGEAWYRPDVTGRFQVDMWWPLTSEAVRVTPRISFDDTCFADGQQISICSADVVVFSNRTQP